jgi:hypothetical protein
LQLDLSLIKGGRRFDTFLKGAEAYK